MHGRRAVQHHAACELLAGTATLATLDLAYYDVGNVAIRAWRDVAAAARRHGLVAAIAADGGLVPADETLIADAIHVAEPKGSRYTTPAPWPEPRVQGHSW